MPTRKPEQPTRRARSTQRLDQHRADHLPPARAHRPEQRELPGALGHDDRERVEDQEHADEQRDRGEAEQDVVEELQQAS